MKTFKSMIVTAVMVLGSTMAQAEGLKSVLTEDVGVTVKAGIAGVGIDVTKGINDYFKVRGGYSSYSLSKTYSQDNVDYQGDLKLGGWSLLGDYHPWAGGFRLTGGVYGPQHKLGASARSGASGTYEFNGNTYSTSDVNGVNLETKWGGVRPYLGIGYDGFNKVKGSGFFFSTDVGVIFSGSPTVSLNGNCTNAAVCSQFNSDLAAEKAKIENDVNKAKYLPVIQIGLGYRF